MAAANVEQKYAGVSLEHAMNYFSKHVYVQIQEVVWSVSECQ